MHDLLTIMGQRQQNSFGKMISFGMSSECWLRWIGGILVLMVVPSSMAFVDVVPSDHHHHHHHHHPNRLLTIINNNNNNKSHRHLPIGYAMRPFSISSTRLFGRRKQQRQNERVEDAVEDVKPPKSQMTPPARARQLPMTPSSSSSSSSSSSLSSTTKFDFVQRLESIKVAIVGALGGGIAVTPIVLLHYCNVGNLAQWEFTTDMSSLQAALFAIVYRYCIRKCDGNNPMLNQGVIGAFVVTRTLANIKVSETCLAVPLRCGQPLEYFDWYMLGQVIWNGLESVVLFGAAAYAIEMAYNRGWISKVE